MKKPIGILSLLIAAMLILVAILNFKTRSHGGNDLIGLFWLALPIGILGILTLKESKWAGTTLLFLFFMVGVWLTIGSIMTVPFPWCLMNVAVGCLAMLPMIGDLFLAKQNKS